MIFNARRAYADGPFGQVHYQWTGEGPAVVLLHQAPMTSFQFTPVIPLLAARGWSVIAIDLPGFGMSDVTAEAPSIADYASVVPAVLDHAGVAKAHLVGHHTGSQVATEAALRYPERVAAVVLNGPYPIDDGERQTLLDTVTAKEKAFSARPEGAHLGALYRNRERLAAGTLPADRLTEFVLQTLMGPGPFWYGHHAAFLYDHETALRALTQPAMILTNTGDMIYEHAQRARAIRPDFAFVALEGGGVDIVDQAPEAWSAVVDAFLKDSLTSHI